MENSVPLVAVIVLTWNQSALTADCVRSLLRVEYPRYQIIVVDNHSEDGTPEKLSEEFDSRIDIIINHKNLGFAAGNNIGIKYALEHNAELILLLNNDTIVAKDFLQPLVCALVADQCAAAATPKIYFLHQPDRIWAAGGKIQWLLGQAKNRGFNQIDRGQFDQAQLVDYATGCCILISRAAIEKVGILDEKFFAYFEDADWSVRACKKGLSILYIPTARIWHVAGASNKNTDASSKEGITSPIAYYLVTRNNLWFLKKYAVGYVFLLAFGNFLVRHLLFYSVVFLFLGRWEKLKLLWQGAKDGWYEK